jgi:predicted ferric reductase
MIYQARNGISLGANETFLAQHQVSADTDLALGRLSTVLEWKSLEYKNYKKVWILYLLHAYFPFFHVESFQLLSPDSNFPL